MKQMRLIGALVFLSIFACGSKKSGPLDPHTFAGIHKDAVTYDCQETQACYQTPDRHMNLPSNFSSTCLQNEADQFSHKPETQAGFLKAFYRCNGFTACEYLDCTARVGGGSTGWGETQMDKITFACQQKTACNQAEGKAPSDAAIEVNNCVGAVVGAVYNFSNTQAANYLSKFQECSSTTACAFVTCFPYYLYQ